MVRLSTLKQCKRHSFYGYKNVDHVYYLGERKLYTIRFYYECHIMRYRHNITLHRLDFTLPWYTGETE